MNTWQISQISHTDVSWPKWGKGGCVLTLKGHDVKLLDPIDSTVRWILYGLGAQFLVDFRLELRFAPRSS